MRYGETGYNLEIDLTTGNIERVETDPKDTELYLGGLGTNAKILWDRVPADIDAFPPIISSYSVPGFFAAHLLPVQIVPLLPPILHRPCSWHIP